MQLDSIKTMLIGLNAEILENEGFIQLLNAEGLPLPIWEKNILHNNIAVKIEIHYETLPTYDYEIDTTVVIPKSINSEARTEITKRTFSKNKIDVIETHIEANGITKGREYTIYPFLDTRCSYKPEFDEYEQEIERSIYNANQLDEYNLLSSDMSSKLTPEEQANSRKCGGALTGCLCEFEEFEPKLRRKTPTQPELPTRTEEKNKIIPFPVNA